jgi:hypothetical protein
LSAIAKAIEGRWSDRKEPAGKRPEAKGAVRGRVAIKRVRQADWDRLKNLALGLGLPGVEETTSYGQPTLKAHAKLWVWWSPHEDAPVFKVPIEEREVLVESDPETFFFTSHYRDHPLVLVKPEKLDLDWAKANLIKVWRAQAPKRLLKAYDAAKEAKPRVASRARRAKTASKASPARRRS